MTPFGDKQDLLDRVIAEYMQAVDEGGAPDPATIIARHPELSAELRAFFETQDVVFKTRADAAQPLRRLGDFEIGREIGRGGMGIVYEARQRSLNRRVALKVLHGGSGLTARAVQRFRREAEAAARLHHTNIVPVYATGEEGGDYYYAMEVIEGPSLDRVIDAMRRDGTRPTAGPSPETDDVRESSDLPGWVLETVARDPGSRPTTEVSAGSGRPGEELARPARVQGRDDAASSSSSRRSSSRYFDTLAGMVADVADALQYAHDHGVIHRDIKPSNLLLSPDGRLSLNDFGLARMVEQPGMTTTGEFVGTPAYMSPEQIVAGRAPVDHRTDIYSLGASLYELLTLERPFPGDRREQVLAQILHKEPRRPRRLQRKIPVDLETICLKALEKDPDRRYQTAGELAGDLRRYVNRFALTARRVGPVGRAIKWVRRRPAVAGLAACVLLLIAVVGLVVHRAHVAEQRHARENALLAAENGDFAAADEAILRAESLGVSRGWTHMLRGQVATHRGEFPEAVRHLEQATELMPQSVAAYAMLTQAALFSGQFERAIGALREVKRHEPVTAEDFLFKGLTELLLEPASNTENLGNLDKAVHLSQSSLAYLARSRVRAYHAWDTGDVSEAERALEDVRVARTKLLGDQPYLISLRLHVHLVAAVCHERAGKMDERSRQLEEARRDVDALEPFRDRSFIGRGWYYEYTGSEDRAFEEWRRAAERGNAWGVENSVLGKYRKGDFEEALTICDQASVNRSENMFELFRGYLLVELGRRDDARQVCEALAQRTGEETLPFYPAMLFPSILRLLGDNTNADELSRRLRGSLYLLPGPPAWLKAVQDYNCNEISDEELLEQAGRSRWLLCEGHFQIALRRLAQGDQHAARRHFAEAESTRFFPFYEYRLSRAFLHRMDADDAWPWIGNKDR